MSQETFLSQEGTQMVLGERRFVIATCPNFYFLFPVSRVDTPSIQQIFEHLLCTRHCLDSEDTEVGMVSVLLEVTCKGTEETDGHK